jgi:hypothetical protein
VFLHLLGDRSEVTHPQDDQHSHGRQLPPVSASGYQGQHQQGHYSQPPYPGQPQHATPSHPPWRHRHRGLAVAGAVFGALVVLGTILDATGHDKPPARAAAAATPSTASATPSARATVKASATAAVRAKATPSAGARTSPSTVASPGCLSQGPACTTSGPTLRGFGATLAQWKAAHTLDLSVPARNAYLPHVAGSGGEDTWQIVTAAGGRVASYALNVVPGSLRSAEERARGELPADARVLWSRTFGDACAQVQFWSATLAAALGDGQVNVEFDNAVSSTVTPVTEELFSTYDAPTVAQAPHC